MGAFVEQCVDFSIAEIGAFQSFVDGFNGLKGIHWGFIDLIGLGTELFAELLDQRGDHHLGKRIHGNHLNINLVLHVIELCHESFQLFHLLRIQLRYALVRLFFYQAFEQSEQLFQFFSEILVVHTQSFFCYVKYNAKEKIFFEISVFSDKISDFCGMEFTTIKIQLGESVAWVNLDRPEVRNALNPKMIGELTEAFGWLGSRDDIRVIVLKGNGKSFCAGADLAYMKDMAGYSYEQNMADAERLSKLFQTIYFCDKAVITVVHGACIGGANGIVAASDIVIAEDKTKFAFSEVRLGITPATISPFVVRRIGQTAAKELMLTGRLFYAEEACKFRLVNTVVDEARLIDVERQYIEHFMHASPDAVAECKRLLRLVDGSDNPMDPLFRQTSGIIASQRVSKAGQEGMTAFFEKRKPEWE